MLLIVLSIMIAAFLTYVGAVAFAKSYDSRCFLFPLVQVAFSSAYIALPALQYAMFQEGEQFTGMLDEDLEVAFTIQLSFMLFYITCFIAFINRPSAFLVRNIAVPIRGLSMRTGRILFILILISGVYSQFSASNIAYGVDQESIISGEADSATNSLLFFGKFLYPLLSVCIIFSYKDRRLIFWPLTLLFATLLAAGATGGTRAAVVHPLIILGMSVWYLLSPKSGVSILAVSVALLIVISPVLVDLRSGGILTTDATAEQKLSAIVESLIKGDSSATPSGSVMSRADILSNTVDLYHYLQASKHYAYFYPYYGVAFSVAPRAIYPDKPYAKSIDGTVRGIPAYALAYIKYRNPNLSITTHGAIDMFWQFGWLGVTLGAAASGALLGVLFNALLSAGPWGFGLALYFSGECFFGAGASLDVVLFYMIQTLVPILVILKLLKLLERSLAGKKYV